MNSFLNSPVLTTQALHPKRLAAAFALLLGCAVSDAQIISTVAGNGMGGLGGDGGQATAARVMNPRTMTFDAAGNMFIADYGNHCIRKVTTAGVISTVAGTGTAGFSGDGGQATAAKLYGPKGITVDAAGNLYISDAYNSRIRKVSPSGIITTIAGTGAAGFTGNGGQATAAQLNFPERTVFDAAGNLYIVDYYNNCIRKVTTAGVISMYAGTGSAGVSGDNGPATSAKLNQPVEATFDAQGNLYISDYGNHRVRKVSTSGIMTTVAGNGTGGFAGDGGQATAAQLKFPYSVSFDCGGNMFIADNGNNRVRMVNPSGVISTIAGTGTGGFSGDGGLATAAQLNSLTGLAFDAAGNLYIADHNSNRVRKIANAGAQAPSMTISAPPVICAGQTASLTASGAGTYTWSTGGTTPGISVTPSVTTSYTVNGGSDVCTGSAVASIIVETCTGIPGHDLSAGFAFYPNPCSAVLTIETHSEAACDLQIMDLTGKLVFSVRDITGQYHMNTEAFTPGLYLLRLQSKDGNISVAKFIKE